MGSQHLLIISPGNPTPPWISRLSASIPSSVIVSSDLLNSSAPKETLKIGFEEHAEIKSPLLYTSISLKPATIKVFSRSENGTKLLEEVHFRSFKSAEDASMQASFLLERQAKQYLLKGEFRISPSPPTRPSNSIFKKVKRWFERDNWIVSEVALPISAFLAPAGKPAHSPILKAETDVLRADPFGIIFDNRKIILYERQKSGENGTIACWDGTKELSLLKKEGHLSYPFIFEDNGKHYCIPEQHFSNRCDLYRIDPSTMELSLEKTLLNGVAASDAIVFKHGELYWLMFTDTAFNGANTRLMAYYSTSLESEFRPHALNPLMVTPEGARNAGTPFLHNGELYRPAQNNSLEYGGSLMLFRVDQLSRDSFEQTLVQEIYPQQFGPQYSGIHTLSAFGNTTLVDLKVKVPTTGNLLRRMRKKQASL